MTFSNLRLLVLSLSLLSSSFSIFFQYKLASASSESDFKPGKMVKNSATEIDEILAKSQRLNSSFADAATATRRLNRGVSFPFCFYSFLISFSPSTYSIDS
jgi:hypothetical protein